MISQYANVALIAALSFSPVLCAHDFIIGVDFNYRDNSRDYVDGVPSAILDGIDDKWINNSEVWNQPAGDLGEGIGAGFNAAYSHNNYIFRFSRHRQGDTLGDEYKIGTAQGAEDWAHITGTYSARHNSIDTGYAFTLSQNITLTPFAGAHKIAGKIGTNGHDHTSTKDDCGVFFKWACSDIRESTGGTYINEDEIYLYAGLVFNAQYSVRNSITAEYLSDFSEYQKYKIEHVAVIGSVVKPVYRLLAGYEHAEFKKFYDLEEGGFFLGLDVTF